MINNTMKFKFWNRGERLSTIAVPPTTVTPPPQPPKDQTKKSGLQWNYVAFTPSNNPKDKDGTKATTFKAKATPPRKRPRKEPPPPSSVKDQHDEGPARKKPVCKIRNSSRKTTLPLLCNSFELKYVMEGHSHLSHQPSTKGKSQKKKDTATTKKKRGRPTKTADDSSDDDDNDDTDNQLDIWSCAFEPSPTKDESSTLVALCGGASILFLDTQQGRYVKKYTHPEPLECFYTLAWTLLRLQHLGKPARQHDDDESDTFACILAAAGKFGSIKLLEPTQTHCYRYLFGHQKPVLKLNFVKKEPRWLLSASMDKTIRLWDIGSPTPESDDSSCLASFSVPGIGHPTSMSLAYDLSFLVAGTNKADLLNYDISSSHIKQWRSRRQKGPVEIKPRSKFPNGDEWHAGYVEDICILGQDGAANEINDYVVSRGSNDMEVLVWNPMTSTKTDSDILLSLNWSESDDCTGLRFTIVEKDGQKVFLGGDYDGDLCLYNIGNGKTSRTLKDGSKEIFDPEKVFSHEASTHLIRDVCVSNDTKKVVAVDSNNNAFVWACD